MTIAFDRFRVLASFAHNETPSTNRIRLSRSSALLVALVFLIHAVPSQSIVVSVQDIAVSGGYVYGNAVILPVGETVSIGARLEDPTASIWTGIGISYYDYDGALLGFSDGEAVSEIFSATCFPMVGCFDSLTNYAGTEVGGPNRELSETMVFPGVPLVDEPRVRAFYIFRHLSSIAGSAGGANDFGLDGVFGGGDAHSRVTFEGLSDGYTSITIGTGDDLGGVILGTGGIPVPGGATNAEIRIAVPEPSFVWSLTAMGVALVASRGSGRARAELRK